MPDITDTISTLVGKRKKKVDLFLVYMLCSFSYLAWMSASDVLIDKTFRQTLVESFFWWVFLLRG